MWATGRFECSIWDTLDIFGKILDHLKKYSIWVYMSFNKHELKKNHCKVYNLDGNSSLLVSCCCKAKKLSWMVPKYAEN